MTAACKKKAAGRLRSAAFFLYRFPFVNAETRTRQGRLSENAVHVTPSQGIRQRGAWRAILSGQARDTAIEAVDQIADALRPAVNSWGRRWDDPAGIDNASLACGRAGAALFYAYRAAALPSRDDVPAIDLLDEALEQMSERVMDCSLFCGFTGVAWLCEQVRALSEEARNQDEDDANEEIDRALLEHVSRPREDGEWDLIDGLVGIGIYGIERLERPAGRLIAEQVVQRLAELARPHEGGLTWPTPSRRHQEDARTSRAEMSFNLGMAHGVPGPLAFLGHACRAGVCVAAAKSLLEGVVPWLLGQQLSDASLSCYPHFRGPGLSATPGRCAWCYGDPGIATALWAAAQGAGREDWRREALSLARHAAERRTERRDVMDAGLCHGAGGVGHIFNRLFQASGDPLLGEAARYWLQSAISKRFSSGGIGRFRTWSQERIEDGEWIDDPRLLTGAAGTGLALLAAATDLPPAWDRFMLLSSRQDAET